MSRRRTVGLLTLLLAGALLAGRAAAFDWKAPVQTVGHLLDRVRQIAQPGGMAVAPGDPAQTASRSSSSSSAAPAGRSAPLPAPAKPAPSHPSREEQVPAPPDSAETVLLEKILLSPAPYSYETSGRRDPFVSLVPAESGSESGADQTAADQLTVRGILWGENDRFALVEDGEGLSFILRQGDHCGRFTVTRIQPSGIEVHSSQYGVGQSLSLPLTEEKGSKHALPPR